jgi:hypothetical protein
VNLILEALEKIGIRINGLKYTFHAKKNGISGLYCGFKRNQNGLKKNIGNLRLASITKYNRDLRVYKIREFLSTIY